MATGTPFPSKDYQILAGEVGDALVDMLAVSLMKTWSVDGNDEISETDVFMQTDPVENVGREKMTFSLQGMLASASDSGQAKIRTHVAARTRLQIACLWDGTNGFTATVLPSQRRANGTAGNGFADVQFDFKIIPSSVTIVGTGPII